MKSGLTFLGIGALAYPTAKPIAEKAETFDDSQ